MYKFTPKSKPIRSRKGKELYKNPEKPFPVKLWKKNRDKVPYLVRAFKLRTRNGLINHLVELADMLLQIESDLKERGEFKLNAENARRFGIKL